MVQGFIGHDVDVVFYLKCNGKPEKVVKQEFLRKPISGWSVANHLKRGKSRNRETVMRFSQQSQ